MTRKDNTMPKRHDADQLIEAHDRVRTFAASLQKEGFAPLTIADGLFAAAVNASIIMAGPAATANCLAEWVERVRNLTPGEKITGTTH